MPVGTSPSEDWTGARCAADSHPSRGLPWGWLGFVVCRTLHRAETRTVRRIPAPTAMRLVGLPRSPSTTLAVTGRALEDLSLSSSAAGEPVAVDLPALCLPFGAPSTGRCARPGSGDPARLVPASRGVGALFSPLHRMTCRASTPPGRSPVRVDGASRRHLVPSSWFLTTSTGSSARRLRACCIPLPILGFAAFRIRRVRGPRVPGRRRRSSRRGSHPSKGCSPPAAAPRHRGRCPRAVGPPSRAASTPGRCSTGGSVAIRLRCRLRITRSSHGLCPPSRSATFRCPFGASLRSFALPANSRPCAERLAGCLKESVRYVSLWRA